MRRHQERQKNKELLRERRELIQGKKFSPDTGTAATALPKEKDAGMVIDREASISLPTDR